MLRLTQILSLSWPIFGRRSRIPNWGDLDAAFKEYDHLYEMAQVGVVTSVTIQAFVNAGLTYGKLDEDDKAVFWLTRAVTFDPQDAFNMHWMAYRNMAIGLNRRGEDLSAALAAISAYEADSEKVELKLVKEMLENVPDTAEYGQVLHFEGKPVELAPRKLATQLEPIEAEVEIEGKIRQLISAPHTNCILALLDQQTHLAVIDSAADNQVRTISAPGTIQSATVVGDELFVGTSEPSEIVQIELSSGAVLRRWETNSPVGSLAVFPSQMLAIYPVGDKLHRLDLDSGSVTETDLSGHRVTADPNQRFCYSYFVERARQPNVGHIIIDGRPILIQRTNFEWSQTALFQLAVSGKQPLLAAMRLNAASNGSVLHVSPDGNFVAVVGGGGWRPKRGGGSYGVAVFSTASFRKETGFFQCDAYPRGVAINSVTQQIVVLNGKEASIQHLSGVGESVKLVVPESGPAAWSADGKYLYLGSKDGLKIWANHLSESERTMGTTWMEKLHVPSRRERDVASPEVEELEFLKAFVVRSERAMVLEVVAKATRQKRQVQPHEWMRYPPYIENVDLTASLNQVVNKFDREDAGIRIFRLKRAEETHPEHPGVNYLLGINYYVTGQYKEASEHMLSALRTDAGRTNISIEALRCLARVSAKASDLNGAAYCMSHMLLLDLANPERLNEAENCFKQAGMEKETKDLIAAGRELAAEGSSSVLLGDSLPSLSTLKEQVVHPADKLFVRVAPSVVMVTAAGNTGTGICIAEGGFVLTNNHVVSARSDRVELIAYAWQDDKLTRLEKVRGTVVFRSPRHDLAIVKANNPPASLKPLPFAGVLPKVGTKVYALGNPGLGDSILDQSFSDGMLSSSEREFGGVSFLQHTAAVNPGNSGGPLLNEFGEVIGVITLKAELERTGFAIPAVRVREVLNSK